MHAENPAWKASFDLVYDATIPSDAIDLSLLTHNQWIAEIGQKRAEAFHHLEQRLQEESIMDLLQRSVNDRWQALIEWAFEPEWQHSYMRLNAHYDTATQKLCYAWWKYPFTHDQSPEAQDDALQKYKSQALAYFLSPEGYFQKDTEKRSAWITQVRNRLDAAVRHRSWNRLSTILDEPGNRLESASHRLLLLQHFLLDEPAFFQVGQNHLATQVSPKEPNQGTVATVTPSSPLKGKPKILYDFLLQRQGKAISYLDIHNHYNGTQDAILSKGQKKTIKTRLKELNTKYHQPCTIVSEQDSITFHQQ